uniref:Uncharacterized protein n=1 Tax=Strombidinopsis acuminata TaxID=141414 RepID=A0A7S3RTK1_9SPIT
MWAAWWPRLAILIGLPSLTLTSAQFHFPQIDTKQITNSLESHKMVADELTHKISEGIKDATKGSSDVQKAAEAIKEVGKQTVQTGLNAMEDLKDAPNVSTALQSAEQSRSKVVGAMRATADAMQKGAEAVNRSSSADMADALQNAGTAASKAASVSGEALQNGAPEAAAVLNSTGLQVAAAIKQVTPKAAEAIKNVGAKDVKNNLDPALSEDQEGGVWGPVIGVIMLAVAAVGGWQAYIWLKGSGPRSPTLLNDADMCVQMRGGGGSLRPSDEQGFFTQF